MYMELYLLASYRPRKKQYIRGQRVKNLKFDVQYVEVWNGVDGMTNIIEGKNIYYTNFVNNNWVDCIGTLANCIITSCQVDPIHYCSGSPDNMLLFKRKILGKYVEKLLISAGAEGEFVFDPETRTKTKLNTKSSVLFSNQRYKRQYDVLIDARGGLSLLDVDKFLQTNEIELREVAFEKQGLIQLLQINNCSRYCLVDGSDLSLISIVDGYGSPPQVKLRKTLKFDDLIGKCGSNEIEDRNPLDDSDEEPDNNGQDQIRGQDTVFIVRTCDCYTIAAVNMKSKVCMVLIDSDTFRILDRMVLRTVLYAKSNFTMCKVRKVIFGICSLQHRKVYVMMPARKKFKFKFEVPIFDEDINILGVHYSEKDQRLLCYGADGKVTVKFIIEFKV